MRVEKLKDGAPNAVYSFERKIIELGRRPNGKPITSVVVVQSDKTRKTAKPRRRPKGNDLIVLQTMETKFQSAAPTMDVLYEAVVDTIECPTRKRRLEYFRKAVQRLADTEVNKWLWRHSGERVALTSVLPGNSAEFDGVPPQA